MMASEGAYSGLKVLDLGQGVAAPYCAMLLAMQAPIHEGDSGGPVVNEQGELVGVTSAILWPAHKTAVAIDVSELRTFLCDKQIPGSLPEVKPADLYSRTYRGVYLVQSPSSTHRASGFIFDLDGKLALTTAEATGRLVREAIAAVGVPLTPAMDGQVFKAKVSR